MYIGSYSISLDAKGRLAFPAKVRELLHADCHGQIVMTADADETCLRIYTRPGWDVFMPKLVALPPGYKKVERMQRLLLGFANSMEIDEENGRVTIPPTLREFAGLEKKLMLVGRNKWFELWSEENWSNYLVSSEGADDAPPELLKDLAL